jgi:hypothetical protein
MPLLIVFLLSLKLYYILFVPMGLLDVQMDHTEIDYLRAYLHQYHPDLHDHLCPQIEESLYTQELHFFHQWLRKYYPGFENLYPDQPIQTQKAREFFAEFNLTGSLPVLPAPRTGPQLFNLYLQNSRRIDYNLLVNPTSNLMTYQHYLESQITQTFIYWTETQSTIKDIIQDRVQNLCKTKILDNFAGWYIIIQLGHRINLLFGVYYLICNFYRDSVDKCLLLKGIKRPLVNRVHQMISQEALIGYWLIGIFNDDLVVVKLMLKIRSQLSDLDFNVIDLISEVSLLTSCLKHLRSAKISFEGQGPMAHASTRTIP